MFYYQPFSSTKKSQIFALGLLSLCLISFFSCKENAENEASEETTEELVQYDESPSDLPIDRLNLPPGFTIEVYADSLEGARSMAMGENGTLFVSTRSKKKVYALQDRDKDYKADRIIILDSTLEVPNGIAFRDGSLYVAQVSRLLRYDNIEANLDSIPEPVVVYEDYPTEFHHGWKYIAFGPDDKLSRSGRSAL